jgi:NADP-dependent 3-hydroxy acid dehydrogenase YdfG
MSVEQRIDMLVNNAGLLAKAPVVEAGMDHFRQVMETNFFGCLELIAAVTPQMLQRQSGGCYGGCSSSSSELEALPALNKPLMEWT